MDTPVEDTLREIAMRYIQALNALDMEALPRCFRTNCVVRDPYGMAIYRGGDEMRQYIHTIQETWQTYRLEPGPLYVGGVDRVVFAWRAAATAPSGRAVTFDGITVLTIKDGLIDGLEAYWDARAAIARLGAGED